MQADRQLVSFSSSITSSYELIQRWDSKVLALTDNLIQAFRNVYSIDRVKISGSVAKGTSICEPDYDVIIFMNNAGPTFRNVIGSFENYLCGLTFPRISHIDTTRFSIKFILDNELHVDLLPANNAVNRRYNPRSDATEEIDIDIQFNNTMLTMSKLRYNRPEMLPFYSSSLSESQVDFLQNQSDFVLCVVKLMKYWYKTACAGNGNTKRSIPGLKFLIELVSVYWGQKEENNSFQQGWTPSAVQALLKIFDKLSNFSKLRVMFKGEQGVSQNQIWNYLRNHNNEDFNETPAWKLECGFFVMDPVNPFNDVLDTVLNGPQPRIVQLIQHYADETLQDLRYGHPSAVLSAVFRNRAFEHERLRCNYRFLLFITVYRSHDHFMNYKSDVQFGEKSRAFDMNAIDTAFQIGAKLESFKNPLSDGYNSTGEIKSVGENIVNGIVRFLEVQDKITVNLRGNSRSGVDFLTPAELQELSRSRIRVEDSQVLQTPIFRSRDIHSQSSDVQALYCCTMVLTSFSSRRG